MWLELIVYQQRQRGWCRGISIGRYLGRAKEGSLGH